MNLANPRTGASIADGSGVATILNDDATLTSLYIADIRFKSKRGGKDWRAVVEVHSEVDNSLVESVSMKIEFADETYTVVTDSSGIASTSWRKDLASGNYYADAYDLVLAGYTWDPFSFNLENDSDSNNLPDDLLTV